jgi:hypothetical protein
MIGDVFKIAGINSEVLSITTRCRTCVLLNVVNATFRVDLVAMAFEDVFQAAGANLLSIVGIWRPRNYLLTAGLPEGSSARSQGYDNHAHDLREMKTRWWA